MTIDEKLAPTLLDSVAAWLSIPVGDSIADHYRTIRLLAWDDDLNDCRVVRRLYQPHSEPAAWQLNHNGHAYRMGQVSGQRMLSIDYEREGDFQ